MTEQKKEKQFNSDSYSNLVNGLGTVRDKTKNAKINIDNLDWETLEDLYEADPMAKRICSIFPYYAMRKNPDVIAEEDGLKELIENEEKRLGVYDKVAECWEWANLFGGCAIVIGAAGETTEPLGDDSPIEFLRVVDRTQINYVGEIDSDFESKNWGEPLYYNVSPVQGTPTKYHHSRIIKMHGDALPRRRYINNQYWGKSVLIALGNTLSKYGQSQDAIANLVIDYRQMIYKFEHLAEIIAQGGEADMTKRIELIDSVRSILNATILGEGESMEIIGTGQASGLKEIIDVVIMRLCAETGVPHTVMLGDSPSGLGATGESERLDFNNLVEAKRKQKAIPALMEIFNRILRTNGKKENTIELVWPSLWLMTPDDELESRSKQADIDQSYVDLGLPTSAILKSRFGGPNGWSFETNVEDQFFEMLDDNEEDLEANAEDY